MTLGMSSALLADTKTSSQSQRFLDRNHIASQRQDSRSRNLVLHFRERELWFSFSLLLLSHTLLIANRHFPCHLDQTGLFSDAALRFSRVSFVLLHWTLWMSLDCSRWFYRPRDLHTFADSSKISQFSRTSNNGLANYLLSRSLCQENSVFSGTALL